MMVIGLDLQHVDAPTIAAVGAQRERITADLCALAAVHGVVVVATCARVEFYIDASRYHEVRRQVIASIAEILGVDELVAEALIVARRQGDALQHLFEVTAGLQSPVVGETQIAGQVRAALLQARLDGLVTRPLAIAFEQAQAVARRVRRTLPARTLIGTALARAGVVHEALIIGTGAYAEVVARTLRESAEVRIGSFSRHGRITAGADFGVDAEELAVALALADVVVACSGRGSEVLTADLVSEAVHLRARTLTIIDLSGGVDVAVDVGEVAGVHVLDLDGIRATPGDDRVVSRARMDIEEAVRAALPRIVDHELDDVIVALREHVLEAAVNMASDGSAEAEAVRRFAQALLHEPTSRARAAAQEGRLDEVRHAIHVLFDIDTMAGVTGRMR